ncbi:MAG: hypothetical protein JOY89_21155 [Solirubrobacterales bacterium]|nr:hypothetical protein [Solirubrobacterales bacterium]
MKRWIGDRAAPAAEKAGNPDGSVAMYTDHVIHDVSAPRSASFKDPKPPLTSIAG